MGDFIRDLFFQLSFTALLTVTLHLELSHSIDPAAAAVGAFSRDKRGAADGTFGSADTAAEIIPLARRIRDLIDGEYSPGTKSFPNLILGRFSLSRPDLLKVLTLDTAAASIRESMHLIFGDNAFRPTDTAAAIRNRTPSIHQTFQDSPGTKGLTG